MPKQKVFSIFDSKTESWAPPFFAEHVGVALRSWSELVNDGRSTVSKFPSDFNLYEIGSFDSANGRIEPIVPVHMVQTALEAKLPAAEQLPFDRKAVR